MSEENCIVEIGKVSVGAYIICRILLTLKRGRILQQIYVLCNISNNIDIVNVSISITIITSFSPVPCLQSSGQDVSPYRVNLPESMSHYYSVHLSVLFISLLNQHNAITHLS